MSDAINTVIIRSWLLLRSLQVRRQLLRVSPRLRPPPAAAAAAARMQAAASAASRSADRSFART